MDMESIHTKYKKNLSRYISALLTMVVVFSFVTPALAETISVNGFNPGANSWVTALSIQPDGKILVGGYFSTLAGMARSRIGRLNSDGTIDSGFNPGANNIVLCLAVQADGKVLVGGTFTILGGATRNYIGRLNLDGTIDTSFNPGANGPVHSFSIQPDGMIIVGGEFTSMGGSPRSKIARLNPNGTLDSTFNPGVSMANISQAIIYTTAVQEDGKILIGGEFTSLAGTIRNRIGRINQDGSFDSTFNPSTNFSTVKNIIIQPDGKILVGEGSLKRLNRDGTLDPDFIAGTNQTSSFALSLQVDGRIILSGNSNGNYIKWLNTDGTLSSTFNPGSNSYINFMELQPNGMLLVAGNFSVLGSTTRDNLGRLINDTSTTLESIVSNTNGTALTWQRAGSGPEISFSTFEVATNGNSYIYLGTGSRNSKDWEISNLNLPVNENLNIRVRGYYGAANGSMSIIEVKENIYIAAPPATLIVTKNTDTNDGLCNLDCSLREALSNVSNSDIITFDPSLTGQTIRLTSELLVDKSITIDGSSLTSAITVNGDADNDGDGDVRLMTIASFADVTINNINFTKGYTSVQLKSGGLNNLGSLTINDSTFSENIGNQGGAIRNSGDLTLNHVGFATNSAPEGGAILNDLNATTTISNSTFNENSAVGQYGTGGAISNVGNLIITGSEFIENIATLGGGAIVNAFGGTTTISDATFSSNTALTDNGGAIYNIDSDLLISETTFYLNKTPLSGGAIYNNGNNVNISKSSFISNNASGEGGGAIFNDLNATVNIENSIFSQNIVNSLHGGGGAIVNIGILEITSSEFSENKATIGGGAIVNLTNGTATIGNTTIAKNLSTDGGAIINLEYSTLTLVNSTLSHNSGGGLYIFGGTVHLKNSILANNTIQPDCYKVGGNVATNLNTLIENNASGVSSCGTPLLTNDPILGTLTGSPAYFPLTAGSPAINRGDDTVCADAPVNSTSQNGVARPQGAHCDIGAFEFESKPDLIITNVTINPVAPGINQTFEVSITVKNQGGETGSNIVYRDVYIDRDPSTLINPATGCPSPGDFYRSDYFTSLPAGWEDTKTITIAGGLPKGQHQFWFYVDSRCLIDEGSGSNSAP